MKKRRTKKSAPKKKGAKRTEPKVVPTHVISEPPLDYGLEDAGNGERFVNEHGPAVRHVRLWGRWLIWDGRIWSEEDNGLLQQLAKRTAQNIYREADSRPAKAKAIMAHAKYSLSVRGREQMLKSASSEAAVLAKPSDFNQQPMLFNVQNGTIDLTTGELRPHRKGDRLTQMAPVEYRAGTKHELWDKFLAQMVPDEEIRDYLQRAAGYTLTGSTREHVFFFMVGRGGSGKGTILDAISSVMGADYASAAKFNILLDKDESRFALARHTNSRMASAQEVNKGARFNSALVKALTGGDKAVAERKFCDEYEFTPQWTWWLAANARPAVERDDTGMWRRLREIPFVVELDEKRRNPRLREILRGDPEAQQAILAWMVEGCLKWQQQGLREPEAIRRACEQYRDGEDNFAEFFGATYVADSGGTVMSADLRAAYMKWCEDRGEEPIKDASIPDRLRVRGFKPDRIGKARDRGWRGFCPREEVDTATDEGIDWSQEPDEEAEIARWRDMEEAIEAFEAARAQEAIEASM